jgi:hypothetical protein
LNTTLAAEHAEVAQSLLRGIKAYSKRLAEMTDDERLQMVVGGGMGRANDDLRWTAELAIAHALTAIALQLTEAVPQT